MNDFIPWNYLNSNCNSYYDLESQTWIKKSPDCVVNPKIVGVNKAIGTIKSYIAKFFNYQT